MWLFDFFKKWNFVRRAPDAKMQGLPKPTRPAPPMPRAQPARGREWSDAAATKWDAPVFAPVIIGSDPAASNEDKTVYWSPLTGAGGAFDGGGASGDWSDSRSCSAPDTSSSSDSGYSDSSSSCDSSSSGSFD